MKRLMIFLAVALAISPALATNNGSGCQGNCPSTGGGTTNNEANGGNGYGGTGGDGTGVGVGVGVGIGLGVGTGGNATGGNAAGGDGGAGGGGGSGGHGGSGGVGIGGAGGTAGVIGSGNSQQGQQQGQGQHQANVGINGQQQGQATDVTSVNGQRQSNANAVDASSRNANQSSAAGNTTVTNVGGDSTLVERNAPPVFLGAITPTSCGGSIQAGASDRNGSGAFGFSWVGTECSIRMIGDRYQQLGMVDTACEVYRSTKAFQKAAKRNPKLASLDCTAKPDAAAAPALVAPELAPRIPRG